MSAEARAAWSVREAEIEDAGAIADAHVASMLELGPSCYAPEMVAEWGEPRDGSRYVQATRGGERLFVAESEGGEVLGFSSAGLADGGSLGVYVRGTAARRGVVSALLAAAEEALRGTLSTDEPPAYRNPIVTGRPSRRRRRVIGAEYNRASSMKTTLLLLRPSHSPRSATARL